MSINEDIKQKSFRSEYEKLAVNIMFTNSWVNTLHIKMLKPFNISKQQFNILRILRGQYPNSATVNLLQARMVDRMSNASRLVEKLRAKGLLERRMSDNDRRARAVIITKEGLVVLSEVDKTEKQLEENLKNISKEEAKELNLLLDKLRG